MSAAKSSLVPGRKAGAGLGAGRATFTQGVTLAAAVFDLIEARLRIGAGEIGAPRTLPLPFAEFLQTRFDAAACRAHLLACGL